MQKKSVIYYEFNSPSVNLSFHVAKQNFTFMKLHKYKSIFSIGGGKNYLMRSGTNTGLSFDTWRGCFVDPSSMTMKNRLKVNCVLSITWSIRAIVELRWLRALAAHWHNGFMLQFDKSTAVCVFKSDDQLNGHFTN